jgi:hypothetical protein
MTVPDPAAGHVPSTIARVRGENHIAPPHLCLGILHRLLIKYEQAHANGDDR